jgi:hypothetical protein
MSRAKPPVVVVSVELELEIVYDGLAKDEIQARLAGDTETAIRCMPSSTYLVTPPVKSFRLVDRYGGHYFPDSIEIEEDS